MNNVQILDCTLRDGAQVNEARFGIEAATDIAKNLTKAKIDIIECGFLKNIEFEAGRTYYPQPSLARPFLPDNRDESRYSALLDFGRYDVDNLEEFDGKTFDLLRVSFFEHNLEDDIEGFIKKIIAKGYSVSVQPMDTVSYSEENLKKVIDLANRVKPETLSIVDTYSLAATSDVKRVYTIYEKYLDKGIKIGFHSHNNQLNSYALAQFFMENSAPDRNLVIDSSLYGMGRGGGNLNTELFAEHLIAIGKKSYDMKPILDTIDEYMTEFKKRYEWGYSMPMLYAGLYGVHVNTVAYLAKKPGITSYDLKMIFQRLDSHKKKRYDYDYLDKVYDEYMITMKKREVD